MTADRLIALEGPHPLKAGIGVSSWGGRANLQPIRQGSDTSLSACHFVNEESLSNLRGCFPQEELPCLGEIKTTLMGMQRECLIGLFTFNDFRGCNQGTVHHHTLGVRGGLPFHCGCARRLEPRGVRRGPRTGVLEPRTLSLQDMPAGILDLLEDTHPHPTPPLSWRAAPLPAHLPWSWAASWAGHLLPRGRCFCDLSSHLWSMAT